MSLRRMCCSFFLQKISALLLLGTSQIALCQNAAYNEQDNSGLSELIVTAGYGTIFGAALGIALIPLTPHNSAGSIRYITVGASLGFLSGSALGLFNIYQSKKGLSHPSDFDYYYYGNSNAQGEKQTESRSVAKKETKQIQVGALFMKAPEGNIQLGIPDVFISPSALQINLASFNF